MSSTSKQRYLQPVSPNAADVKKAEGKFFRAKSKKAGGFQLTLKGRGKSRTVEVSDHGTSRVQHIAVKLPGEHSPIATPKANAAPTGRSDFNSSSDILRQGTGDIFLDPIGKNVTPSSANRGVSQNAIPNCPPPPTLSQVEHHMGLSCTRASNSKAYEAKAHTSGKSDAHIAAAFGTMSDSTMPTSSNEKSFPEHGTAAEASTSNSSSTFGDPFFDPASEGKVTSTGVLLADDSTMELSAGLNSSGRSNSTDMPSHARKTSRPNNSKLMVYTCTSQTKKDTSGQENAASATTNGVDMSGGSHIDARGQILLDSPISSGIGKAKDRGGVKKERSQSHPGAQIGTTNKNSGYDVEKKKKNFISKMMLRGKTSATHTKETSTGFYPQMAKNTSTTAILPSIPKKTITSSESRICRNVQNTRTNSYTGETTVTKESHQSKRDIEKPSLNSHVDTELRAKKDTSVEYSVSSPQNTLNDNPPKRQQPPSSMTPTHRIRSLDSQEIISSRGLRTLSGKKDRSAKNLTPRPSARRTPTLRNTPDQTRRKIDNPPMPSDAKVDPAQRAGMRLLSAAAIPIQTEIRRFLAERKALHRIWAIVVVQACIRGYIAQQNLKKFLSARTIQSNFRRYRDKRHLKEKQISAKIIQASYRGWTVRDNIAFENDCAILIQSEWRRWATETDFVKYKKTRMIQAAWRRWSVEKEYKQYKSARTIQSVWRRLVVEKEYKQYKSARTIQSAWRRFFAEYAFSINIDAVTTIQAIFRQWTVERELLESQTSATKIQALYRGWTAREILEDQCYSITIIQSAWRRWSAEGDLNNHRSARTIQSAWRSYDCSMNYLHTLADILVVQSVVRRWIAMKAYPVFRQERLNHCATEIQRLMRGHLSRTHLLHHFSAMTIQSAWRRWSAEREYKQYKSARTIQSAWRRWSAEREYKQYKSARMIQTVWRRFFAEYAFSTNIDAVTTIQAIFRQWTVERELLESQTSATKIQALYRGWTAREILEDQCYSITIIQSAWRRWSAEGDLNNHRSARTIQSAWRSYDCSMNYLHTLADILVVQSVVRRWIAMKAYPVFRQERLNHCATEIQRLMRGHLSRTHLLHHFSAMTIQSAWRRFVLERSFRNNVLALTTIQAYFRRWIVECNLQKEILYATMIQALYRGWVVRLRQDSCNFSGILIQSAWRRWSAEREYKQYKSARTIQSAWRRFFAEREYKQYKSARMIQSAWRRFFAEYAFSTNIDAVTTIQAIFRLWILQCRLREAQTSATKIQALYRGWATRGILEDQCYSITIIQSAWRRLLAELKFRQYKSARMIQAAWRRFRAENEFSANLRYLIAIQAYARRWIVECKVQEENASSAKIQALYRGWATREIQKDQCYSIAIIQSAWRLWSVEKEYKQYKSARTIQSAWRRWSAEREYKQYKSARTIQSAWRRFFAEYAFSTNIDAVTTIQAIFRQWTVERELLESQTSATKIQALYRGWTAREILEDQCYSITIIQSAWRRWSAEGDLNNHRSARTIQSAWRSYDCSMNYLHTLADILVVQSVVRRWIAMKAYPVFRQERLNHCATEIQRLMRGHLSRTHLLHHFSAMTIQSAWRRFVLERSFRNNVLALTTIQAYFRRWIVECNLQKEILYATMIQALYRGWVVRLRQDSCNFSGILIQSAWRRWSAEREYKQYKSARTIQSAWRRFFAEYAFSTNIDAVTTIQAIFRQWTVERELLESQTSATKIQALYRGWTAREILEDQCYSITIIQSAWRRWSAEGDLNNHRSARTIQSAWRSYDCSMNYLHTLADILVVQSVVRRWIAMKAYPVFRQERLNHCATEIQRLMRGHLSRTHLLHHFSAMTIQSAWRRWSAEREYKQYKSARTIQSAWRRWSAEREYKQYKSARMIQTVWRRWSAEQEYKQYKSARTIQSVWRRLVVGKEYKQYKSARTIQSAWRRFFSEYAFSTNIDAVKTIQTYTRRCIVQCRLREAQTSATKIQALYRGWATREILEDQCYSIAIIQSAWRRWSAEQEHKQYKSARTIQAAWRRWSAEHVFIDYTSARTIQSAWRQYSAGFLFKSTLLALTSIQAYARRWIVECRVRESQRTATKIQALYRGGLLRTNLRKKEFCALELQRFLRGCGCRAKVNRKRSDLRDNGKAVIMQACWRRYSAQLNYHFDLVDIIIVQSAARRKSAYRLVLKLEKNRDEESARVIQSAWRSYDCSMNYLHTLADILVVQSVVRRWIAMKAYPVFRQERLNHCATEIQRLMRGHLSRTHLLHHFSVTEIQSAWRRWSAEREYKRYKSARTIQSAWRRWSAEQEYKQYKAARSIQTCFRRHRDSCDYQEIREYVAATEIQRSWRGFQCFTDYVFTVADIVIAQRTARRWLALREVQRMREDKAATAIQSAFRCFSCRVSFLYTLVHVIVVQSIARRKLHAKNFPKLLLDYKAARTIQSFWRCRNAFQRRMQIWAARLIQAEWLRWSAENDFKQYKSSRSIQALWRGHALRRRFCNAATHIQSAWRCFGARAKFRETKMHLNAIIGIQAAWRGYWQFTGYVIIRHEIVRVQAIVRGYQQRQWLNLQRNCAIAIQCAARSFAVKRERREHKLAALAVNAAIAGLRSQNSAKIIQRFYCHNAHCKKEKQAALVIERFFIAVKLEIEKELKKFNKKQKRQKRRRHKKEEDEEKLLEYVWRNTEEERIRCKTEERKRGESPRLGVTNLHRHTSDLPTLGGQPKPFRRPPTATIHADDHTEVSGITSPTLFAKNNLVSPRSRLKSLSRRELKDDLSLEEAWIDTEVFQAKEKMRSEKKHIQNHGLDGGGALRVSRPKTTKFPVIDENSGTAENIKNIRRKARDRSRSRDPSHTRRTSRSTNSASRQVEQRSLSTPRHHGSGMRSSSPGGCLPRNTRDAYPRERQHLESHRREKSSSRSRSSGRRLSKTTQESSSKDVGLSTEPQRRPRSSRSSSRTPSHRKPRTPVEP